MAKELPNEIKIEHKNSPSFSSCTATGSFISGTTADGFSHITFFKDVSTVTYQKGTKISERSYKTELVEDGMVFYRENQVCVSYPANLLSSLYEAIGTQIQKNEAAAAKKN